MLFQICHPFCKQMVCKMSCHLDALGFCNAVHVPSPLQASFIMQLGSNWFGINPEPSTTIINYSSLNEMGRD